MAVLAGGPGSPPISRSLTDHLTASSTSSESLLSYYRSNSPEGVRDPRISSSPPCPDLQRDGSAADELMESFSGSVDVVCPCALQLRTRLMCVTIGR